MGTGRKSRQGSCTESCRQYGLGWFLSPRLNRTCKADTPRLLDRWGAPDSEKNRSLFACRYTSGFHNTPLISPAPLPQDVLKGAFCPNLVMYCSSALYCFKPPNKPRRCVFLFKAIRQCMVMRPCLECGVFSPSRAHFERGGAGGGDCYFLKNKVRYRH